MENMLTDPDLSSAESGNLKVILGLRGNRFISFTISEKYSASSFRERGNVFISAVISEKNNT